MQIYEESRGCPISRAHNIWDIVLPEKFNQGLKIARHLAVNVLSRTIGIAVCLRARPPTSKRSTDTPVWRTYSSSSVESRSVVSRDKSDRLGK